MCGYDSGEKNTPKTEYINFYGYLSFRYFAVFVRDVILDRYLYLLYFLCGVLHNEPFLNSVNNFELNFTCIVFIHPKIGQT